MEVDQRAIDAFRAMRPEEGAKLDALLALAPDVVMAAIRGDEMTPSQRAAAEADAADRHARSERGEPQPAGARLQPTSVYREEALREALTEKGLPPEEIERHVGELRELLKTPDQRVADYRDAILSGQLTPKEIADWHAFAARKTPDQPQVPLEHLQAELVSQFAQKLAASGGGFREFIGAVRELEAWKAKVAGLDAEAAAALPRQIRADELDRYRGLKPTKKANPQRDALRELDKTEATKRLATEILSKFTGDPNQHAALLAEWETARREAGVDPAVIATELGHLNTVLTHPELSTRLQKAVAAYTAQDVKSVSLEAMALADPVLLALAATNRAQFIERFGAMMQREAGARAEFIKKLGAGKFAAEYDKRTLNAGDFRAEVDTDMAARIKSVASEAAATFNVAEAMGLAIIKSDSTSRGQTNQAGIDIVAVEPTPEMGPRPEKVPVHLFDDKAVAAPLLGDVTALTKNLAKNLETAAGGPLESLLAAEKAGLPIDLDHKAALTPDDGRGERDRRDRRVQAAEDRQQGQRRVPLPAGRVRGRRRRDPEEARHHAAHHVGVRAGDGPRPVDQTLRLPAVGQAIQRPRRQRRGRAAGAARTVTPTGASHRARSRNRQGTGARRSRLAVANPSLGAVTWAAARSSRPRAQKAP